QAAEVTSRPSKAIGRQRSMRAPEILLARRNARPGPRLRFEPAYPDRLRAGRLCWWPLADSSLTHPCFARARAGRMVLPPAQGYGVDGSCPCKTDVGPAQPRMFRRQE